MSVAQFRVENGLIPAEHNDADLGHNTAQWKDVYVAGDLKLGTKTLDSNFALTSTDLSVNQITLGSLTIDSSTTFGLDSAGIVNIINANPTLDSALVVNIINQETLDSNHVKTLIAEEGLDSALVNQIISQATSITDSSLVQQLIDSAYVQGKIPGSFITTQIDNEGYLYANQPLIQSFITGFSSPIVTIDSAFIQARAGGGGDSAINSSNALLATNATKLNTPRNIAISGFATGNANFDGSGDITISTTGSLSGSLSGDLTITDRAIKSNASSNWTGDPGSQGKIQYHSNRWYIVADQSSNRIVQFRRNSSDVSYVDNSGVYQGRATSANWADLAEKYEADKEYDEGTVVAIGGDKEITEYREGMPLAGVVSFHPGVRMNVTEENMEDPLFPFVALKGRVPVKIKGSATKGDYIIADDNGLGVAWWGVEPNFDPYKLIGIALETGSDMIEVKV